MPVPPIFLFERDYNAYEVIDGRQRLDSIRGYLANEFPLSGLEFWSELDRKRFTDLPMILQRGLLRRSVSAVVLLAETRDSGTTVPDLETGFMIGRWSWCGRCCYSGGYR
jgi:hypothetical protein